MGISKHPVTLAFERAIAKPLRWYRESREDYVRIRKQYAEFKALNASSDRSFSMDWNDRMLVAGENTNVTRFSAHYIYHPAWAARIVKKIAPTFHTDISSTLHFCSIVSAFIPIKFYDYRPANIHLSDLHSGKADLTALPFADGSIESISCMHTIEHIGMGRYGDPIDPEGDLKAIKELQRVTRKGGSILFVIPIGKPRIMWNAHRIYSYKQVMSYFTGFDMEDFYLIPDNAAETSPVENATEAQADAQKYGCGCFWFVKR
mgnify:CR=1 FL=1